MTQTEFQERFGGEIINDWLVFSGDLNCSNNQLTSLPEKLKVGGSLYCYNNQLTSLPEKLNVGSLYCYNNKLTSLPEKLKVGSYLNCYNNKLTSLPEKLKVGSLDCSHNQLTSLPEKLKINNNLDCSHNQLTSVPNYIKNIKYCYIFQNLNWNDPVWINKILKDELTPDEVFAIDNIEHRRIAYQYMDKTKMKQLKDYKVLDENTDMNGNKERIVSFTVQNMKESLKFLNVICPTGREYFLGTDKDKCSEAQKALLGLDSDVEFIKRW